MDQELVNLLCQIRHNNLSSLGVGILQKALKGSLLPQRVSAFASDPVEAPQKDRSIWIRHTGAELQRLALMANNLPVILATSVCERRDRTVSQNRRICWQRPGGHLVKSLCWVRATQHCVQATSEYPYRWRHHNSTVLWVRERWQRPGQGRTSREQPAHLLNLSGLGCTIGCLVWEGDACDQHKQISEGRTELHVE